MRGVGMAPAFEGQTIPATVFMIFQAMFACITPGKALSLSHILFSLWTPPDSSEILSFFSPCIWCRSGTYVGKFGS